MRIKNCRLRILPLLCLLLQATIALAEDIDVKSGFFQKDVVNKDLFQPRAEEQNNEAANPAGIAVQPPQSDSWTVDGSSFKEQDSKAKAIVEEVRKDPTRDPSAPFSREEAGKIPPDLTNAARTIEQLKSMLRENESRSNVGRPEAVRALEQLKQRSTPSTESVEAAPEKETNTSPVARSVEPKLAPETPPVLEVYVSALPERHLLEQLDHIAALKKDGEVQIGRVVVFGLNQVYEAAARAEEERIYPPISQAEQEAAEELERRISGRKLDDPDMFREEMPAKPPVLQKMDALNLVPSGAAHLQEIQRRYHAESSPIWIVRHQGKEHVFEGKYNPEHFFDNRGRFIAVDRHNPREEGDVVVHMALSGSKFLRNSANDQYNETGLSYQIHERPKRAPTAPTTAPKTPGKFALPNIPICPGPQSRKTAVAQTMKNSGFDLVFYAANDAQQSAAARNWEGRTVGYNSGQLVDYKDPRSQWQLLALSARIRCLPTRFHFYEENGKRYLEYLEGNMAWGSP